MVHSSWLRIGGLPLEIMEGKHDDELDYIAQACSKRSKTILRAEFRLHQRVKLVNTGRAEWDGTEGEVAKINKKTVAVMLDDGRQPNVPPNMLVAL